MPLAVGCAKRQSTMAPPPRMKPDTSVEANPEARADELEEASRRFEETARQLPGRSDDEHRRLVQQAFAELARALPLLYGAEPPGTFRQQVRVVESSRAQLASGPRALAPEPTIDTGLRAARDALESLAGRGYFDRAKLAPLFDRLNGAVASLDTTRGPMHQSAVAESAQAMAEVVRRMAEAMAQPAEGQAPPAESPAAADKAPANPPDQAPEKAPDNPPDAASPPEPAPGQPGQ